MLTKDELIRLKDATAKRLRSIDVLSYNLEKADSRLSSYVRSCINNPNDHNLYELLSIARFFRFLDTYDFIMSEVRKFIVFYESLKFRKDKVQANAYTSVPVRQHIRLLSYRNKETCHS